MITKTVKVTDKGRLLNGAMKKFRNKYTSVELQHQAAKIWTKDN